MFDRISPVIASTGYYSGDRRNSPPKYAAVSTERNSPPFIDTSRQAFGRGILV